METVKTSAPGFTGIVERFLGKVFHFCFRMTLHHDDAAAACFETFCRASVGEPPTTDAETELWLLRIAAHVTEQRLPPAPEVSFELLDETLRSEATRTGEVASLTDPQREVLLWELKQGCMTAVVNCLPPGERVAFVMSAVLGLSDDDAARSLGIRESAFKVRLSRARKKIGDYLAPRCEHIDPRNPCRCPSRIGVALRKGFIAPPARSEVSLRTLPPFDEEQKMHDAAAIYRMLPEPDVPPSLREQIHQAIASGSWDGLRAQR
ncbi:MAG: RNA polymerase sigma factor [Myxococcales bacterium]|nr:RNA polymerase sigma factor [Myxococcales bacterium]